MRTICGLSFVGLLGSCVEAIDVPEPPATAELEQAYLEATGELSEQEVQNTVTSFREGEPVERAFDSQDYVDEVVETTASLTNASGKLDLGRIELEGEAVLSFERDCEDYQDTRGHLSAQVTFTLVGLRPVIWGKLQDCVRATANGRYRFTGDFIIVLDQVEDFEIDPNYWTHRFQGQIEDLSNEDIQVIEDGEIDCQRRGSEIRLRISTGDGNWAFLSYDQDSPEELSLIDRTTTYSCDLEQMSCSP